MPTINEHEYVNRKNDHTINVQLICDALIMNCVVKWPWSVHDVRIMRECPVFKNSFTLSLLLKPELLHADAEEIDCGLFAPEHGKGPVHGVGGTVKLAVWQRVLQRKALVNSSKDFAVVAKAACLNIHEIHVESDKVNERNSLRCGQIRWLTPFLTHATTTS